MPEPEKQPANITYNYTIEQVRVLYGLTQKPATMSDHEWAIVSDEGFRKYMASQLGLPYYSRQTMHGSI